MNNATKIQHENVPLLNLRTSIVEQSFSKEQRIKYENDLIINNDTHF
jgi:hypothetical protein